MTTGVSAPFANRIRDEIDLIAPIITGNMPGPNAWSAVLDRFDKPTGPRLVMLSPSARRSFYISTSRTGNDRDAWSWEIRRKRKPMGVRLWEGGFRSRRAAELAGKEALEDFLNGLSLVRHLTYGHVPMEREIPKRMAGRRPAEFERKSLKRDIAKRPGMTFVVHCSRGTDTATTIRLSVTSAVAKARALAEGGWKVSIADQRGYRYDLVEFETLLSLGAVCE